MSTTASPVVVDAHPEARPALRALPGGRPHQPMLPLAWDLPSGLPAAPPPPRHLRLVAGADTPGLPSPDPRLPSPAPWIARLAPAILEVIAGERPPGQLQRWTSREVHATLTRRSAAALRHPAGRDRIPPCRRVRSVRLCPISPGVVEACAVVIGGERARAVALRVEALRGRWQVTACEVG